MGSTVPDPADLPAGAIAIWCARPDELGDDGETHASLDILTDDERARWRRFRFGDHRRRFLATRLLARRVLSMYDPRPPSAWRFQFGAHGRPAIAGENSLRLQFNLSRTAELVVCAISRDCELGVDVENTTRRAPLDVANRFFAPIEVQELRSHPPESQPRRFFEYWTLKESYIKARGKGLAIPLDQFAFHLAPDRPPRIEIDPRQYDEADSWQFVQIEPAENYLVALCVRSRQPIGDVVHVRWCSLVDNP